MMNIHSCSIIGAFFIANSIKDSQIIFYSPAGCKKNILHTLAAHDLDFDDSRLHLHQIGDMGSVFGDKEGLMLKIRKLLEKKPSQIFVITSCVPEIMGEDIILDEGMKDHVTVFNGLKGDVWQGYQSALKDLVTRRCKGDAENGVNIVGFINDRKEGDVRADISAIKDILDELDMDLRSFLMEDMAIDDIKDAAKAKASICFKHGRETAEIFRQNGQVIIYPELPIGLEHTIRFINDIANNDLADKEKARSYIDRSLSEIVPKIYKLTDMLKSKKVAIFSDSQKIPGLSSFVSELGMEPIISVAHDSLPDSKYDANVDKAARKADIIIGTQVEKQRYGDLTPVLETGFPSFDRHVLTETPYLGFNGALNLAQDIHNLIAMKNDRFIGIRHETLKLGLDNDIYIK